MGLRGAGMTRFSATANRPGVLLIDGAPACGISTWQATSSMPAGTPARTWQGLRG